MHFVFPPCSWAALTTHKTRARWEMLTSSFFEERRRLFLFPKTPHRNVAQVECVPPRVHHLRVESERAFTRYACRWRRERCQAGVYLGALLCIHSRQQMPQRESIAVSGLRKNCVQRLFPIGGR